MVKDIGFDYCDIELFALEMNQYHSVIFEITPKYCILDSFVDYDGYSISSKGFLPTVVYIMIIWVKFTHSSPGLSKRSVRGVGPISSLEGFFLSSHIFVHIKSYRNVFHVKGLKVQILCLMYTEGRNSITIPLLGCPHSLEATLKVSIQLPSGDLWIDYLYGPF